MASHMSHVMRVKIWEDFQYKKLKNENGCGHGTIQIIRSYVTGSGPVDGVGYGFGRGSSNNLQTSMDRKARSRNYEALMPCGTSAEGNGCGVGTKVSTFKLFNVIELLIKMAHS